VFGKQTLTKSPDDAALAKAKEIYDQRFLTSYHAGPRAILLRQDAGDGFRHTAVRADYQRGGLLAQPEPDYPVCEDLPRALRESEAEIVDHADKAQVSAAPHHGSDRRYHRCRNRHRDRSRYRH